MIHLKGLNHIAGPYRDGVQRCTRCGAILVEDAKDALFGSLRGFKEGPLYASNPDDPRFGFKCVGYDYNARDCKYQEDQGE